MHTKPNQRPPPPPQLDAETEEGIDLDDSPKDFIAESWNGTRIWDLGEISAWKWSANSLPILVARVAAKPSHLISIPMYSHWQKQIKAAIESKTISFPEYDHYAKKMNTKERGTIMLDIGAGIGLASLGAAALGYRVVAFEPIPLNVEKLAQSAIFNGFQRRYTIVQAAATSRREIVWMYAPHGREDLSAISLEVATGNSPEVTSEEHRVSTETIDGWLTDHPEISRNNISYVKVSAEGAELEVLRGARELLTEYLLTLEVEVIFAPSLMRISGSNPVDLLNFMSSLGYDVYRDDELLKEEDFITVSSQPTRIRLRFFHRG